MTGESSLTRDSFNSIVRREQFNAPEAMQRCQNMSRLVMLDGRYTAPAPLMSRAAVAHLTPVAEGSLRRFMSDPRNVTRSLSFHSHTQPFDGMGSFRMGTPVPMERSTELSQKKEVGLPPDATSLQRSNSVPAFRKTPHQRFGYMPADGGVVRPFRRKLTEHLADKVRELHMRMDRNGDGLVTKQEARQFFKKFGEVSAQAMFKEVDEDENAVLSLDEFEAFFEQVKNSGYSEEDLDFELDELLEGNVWVDFDDQRNVGAG